jgi:hypothetical protein
LEENKPAKTDDNVAADRTASQHPIARGITPEAQDHEQSVNHIRRTAPNWTEKGIFALTGLYCIMTGLYCCFSYRQWQEMVASTKATQAAVAESQRQFGILQKKSIGDDVESKRRFEDTLKQAQANATTEQGLTRRGLAQSRAALEVSRRQMIESLRAKVFIKDLSVDFDKSPPAITGKFQNSGALAAEGVSWGWTVAWGNVKQAASVPMISFTNPVVPNADHPFGSDLSLAAEVIKAVKDGTIPFWIWIRVKYGDRLARAYPPETVCYTYSSYYKMMSYCERGKTPARPP